MKIKNQKIWEDIVRNNTEKIPEGWEGYCKAALRYLENWAELMESEIKKGKKLEDIAEKTSNIADTEGITGFQYGWAVSILAEIWEYGEQLRKWHNSKYGQPDSKGTINPAVLNIKIGDD